MTRNVDHELFDCLRRRQFCSILTSRQVGKSSLIARTAVRLRAAGIDVSFIDLNRIGATEQTRETWYYSLLLTGGKNLGFSKKAIDAYWQTSNWPTPMQKWLGGIEELFLADRSSDLIIFIDEIDDVRNAEFKDEFFAAIRSCYNRRSTEPAFQRLTFCLVGSAMPGDLIADPELTPFNVGRSIELTDFTVEEARCLAPGLGRPEAAGKKLIDRICYWTGGHPYLTHRLCVAVAEDPSVATDPQVDRLVARTFFSTALKEPDMNLTFVRDRILRTMKDEEGLATLLTLYKNVRTGKRVPDRKADPFSDVLRLSGVVRSDDGWLVIRNRIYARVFDQDWVRESMPDAETRRQRAAFLKGAFRAASILSAVVLVVSALAIVALREKHEADLGRARADAATIHANHLAYVANMANMSRLWENANISAIENILWKAKPDDRKNFEWRYWIAQIHQNVSTLGERMNGKIAAVVFSPKGHWWATAGEDPYICIWEAETRKLRYKFHSENDYTLSLAVTPDGNGLLAGGRNRMPVVTGESWVARWEILSQAPRQASFVDRFSDEGNNSGGVNCVRISPDGRWYAAAISSGHLRLRDSKNGDKWLNIQASSHPLYSLAFHPTLPILASGDLVGKIRFWNAVSGLPIGNPVTAHTNATPEDRVSVDALAFSPNGSILAAASKDDLIRLWDARAVLANRKSSQPAVLRGSKSWVSSLVFIRGGRQLLSCGRDNTIRCWDVRSRSEKWAYKAHRRWINCLAVDERRNLVASVSDDHTALVWSLNGPSYKDAGEHGPPPSRSKKLPFNFDSAAVRIIRGFGSEHLVLPSILGEILTLDTDPSTLKVIRLATSFPGVVAVHVSRDQKRMLAININSQLVSCNLDVGVCSPPQTLPLEPIGGRGAAAISPDLNWISLAYHDGRVVNYNLASRRSEVRFQIKDEIREHADIEWSPPGDMAQALAANGALRILSTPTRSGVASYRVSQLGGIQFSPSGRYILLLGSGDPDADFFMYSSDLVDKPEVFQGHNLGLLSAAFSPDESRIATVSSDGLVKLWDRSTLQELLSLQVGNTEAGGIAFTNAGDRLALVDGHGTVTIWAGASDSDVATWEVAWNRLQLQLAQEEKG